MKLSTSLVAVKKITCQTPRSIFADEELEQAAKLILQSEGVINPVVVRRTSLQSYEVVDGDFEYYAASRAREIDPRKGEMIGVFIIEPENEEVLTQQVKLFRKKQDNSSDKKHEFSSETLDNFLKNLESRFEKITNQIMEQERAKQKLESEIKDLKSQLANKTEPLDVFNNLNVVQLALRLKSTGLSETKAKNIAEIVDKERNKKQFESLNDVVERVKLKHGKRQVKAISSEKMLDIVDTWSRILLV